MFPTLTALETAPLVIATCRGPLKESGHNKCTREDPPCVGVGRRGGGGGAAMQVTTYLMSLMDKIYWLKHLNETLIFCVHEACIASKMAQKIEPFFSVSTPDRVGAIPTRHYLF